MLVNKGFRFRIYPQEPQRMMFAAWFGCDRFVGNLAIDQRRTFSRKGRNITYAMQAAELPALRAEFPWLAECPNQVLQQSLRAVDRAFVNFFEGRGAYPRKRKKFERDSVRFPALEQRQRLKKNGEVVLDEQGEQVWQTHSIIELGEDWIDLPKMGRVRWVRHRAIEGSPLNVTISRQGGMYFASVCCEVEVDVADAPKPTLEAEAYDYGLRQDYTTSDGTVFDVPGETSGETRRRCNLENQIARRVAARVVAEKEAGCRLPQSRRELKVRAELRALDARLARRAHDALHKYTTGLVRKAAVIGFEDLDIKAMTASSKGTVAQPGRNIAQKSGLNRGLLHGRPGMARMQVEYKTRWMGRRAVAVPPAFTSQYCSTCAAHPKDDTTTAHLPHGRVGAVFTCPLCGFTCDADQNAAGNIRREAVRIAALPEHARPATRRERARAGREMKRTTAGGHPVALRGAHAKEQAMNRGVQGLSKAA